MDIGSLYGDYLKSSASKASNLERTLSGTNRESSEDELLDACKQFETYFYEQLFKGMEKAMVPKDDSDANNTMISYYKENLISEYSKQVVDQSGENSLSHQLYEQMKRNYGIDDIKKADSEETGKKVDSAEADKNAEEVTAAAGTSVDNTSKETVSDDEASTEEVAKTTGV